MVNVGKIYIWFLGWWKRDHVKGCKRDPQRSGIKRLRIELPDRWAVSSPWLVVLWGWTTMWWFQICSIFIPTWADDPIWLLFFKWVASPPPRQILMVVKRKGNFRLCQGNLAWWNMMIWPDGMEMETYRKEIHLGKTHFPLPWLLEEE